MRDHQICDHQVRKQQMCCCHQAIRRVFASVNGRPEVVEAVAEVYYSTLDGFGQKHLHQVLLDNRLHSPCVLVYPHSSQVQKCSCAAFAYCFSNMPGGLCVHTCHVCSALGRLRAVGTCVREGIGGDIIR